MRKYILFIISIVLILNLLVSPFYYLNIREKISILIVKNEFEKKSILIDSVRVSSTEGSKRGGKYSSTYYLFYGDKNITLLDASAALFNSKNTELRTKRALNYLEAHNDSLLIWYHPTINGRYALEEETEMNTDGFITQIIINSILLVIALYSIIWQIKEWRKPKKK
ncbi:hypothetical protein [Maribacter polysaccharolyticus]|uniref:hypothetical protein n=1 Tax=Maribacter polysaccharolyticus TaxID=3020831 RepID=UPI00237FCECB|nr:hypothetical protein [Maribacter polysaccharolyticus]MDE3743064.1 hypothetical protein [Maribacter polysaccharolyticus]